MKWRKRIVVGVLEIVLLLAAALWIYAHRTLPQTDGSIAVPGLASEVRIERDAHGIPTIKASTPAGALSGPGYAHAQDRLS